MRPAANLILMKPALRFLCLGLLGGALRAEVTLAPLFTNHAVLQREKPIPVWGRAAPGEHIVVSFHGQTLGTTTSSDGRWMVFLEASAASNEGTDLVVAGNNTVTLHDVVVGEVWLCSGQSNMEFTVKQSDNAAAEIASARFPLIRHVQIARQVAETPADTVATSGWLQAAPETVGNFTAVGYFFARDIFKKLNVPVGVVHSSWSGSPVESWLSPATARRPDFAFMHERWAQNLAEFPARKSAFDFASVAWNQRESVAKAKSDVAYKTFLKDNPKPRAPRGPGDSWTPTGLFNGMINPLLPYALRGALWYQGESNADHASEYHALFSAMITGWRGHFGQGDFPFYWVSLANYKAPEDKTNATYAFLREAQTQTLALPQTGQALAIDLGNPDNVHPTNKQDVGRRLALLAKNRLYGAISDDTGPTFTGATREGSALRIKFAHASSGLIAHDKPVQSLEVAGPNKVFRPASAKIDRDALLVSAPDVKEPVAVRYAWKNSPEANLYNGAGLPAVPFRSDNW